MSKKCEICKHFINQHCMEIDHDVGDYIEVVKCVMQVFATPDMAESCEYFEAKGGSK